MATGGTSDTQRWQIAISLVAAWREYSDERRAEAVAERLAAVAVERGPAAVEQAALGLTDIAGMFMELYADCAGRSLDSILADAEAVRDPDAPPAGAPGATEGGAAADERGRPADAAPAREPDRPGD